MEFWGSLQSSGASPGRPININRMEFWDGWAGGKTQGHTLLI